MTCKYCNGTGKQGLLGSTGLGLFSRQCKRCDGGGRSSDGYPAANDSHPPVASSDGHPPANASRPPASSATADAVPGQKVSELTLGQWLATIRSTAASDAANVTLVAGNEAS